MRREWPGSDPADRHYLTGKVICGGCSHAMSHVNGTQVGLSFYTCRHRFYLPDRDQCVASILDRDLEDILEHLLREKILSLPDLEAARRKKDEQLKKQINDAENRLVMMQKSREKISSDLFQAYESYKEGRTGKETYLQQKAAYEEMLDKLSCNINSQEEAIAKMEMPQDQADERVTLDDLRKYLTPDRTFAELFIRQITVYADRRIEVVWNFREEWLDK